MKDISKVYADLYGDLLRSGAKRFILLQPRDGCGWGNQLRGLTLCMIFAVCSRRIMVVDDFLLEEHFLPPEGTDWSIRRWQKALSRISDRRVMNLHLRSEDFDAREWKEYETQNLDALFPESLIILNQSIGFIDAIFRNPHYKPFLKGLGFDIDSKLSWLGSICEYLFSRPSPRLKRAVERLSKKFELQAPPDIGIQFRSFYDVGFSNAKHVNAFIEGARKIVASSSFGSVAPRIFVTADHPAATRHISLGLMNVGSVLSWPHRPVHTAEMSGWISRQIEKVLTRLLGDSARGKDPFAWLPRRIRHGSQTMVLAEWFLLGDCRMILSIFSSFAVFAAARTGNSAALWRFDTESGAFAPLRNKEYFY